MRRISRPSNSSAGVVAAAVIVVVHALLLSACMSVALPTPLTDRSGTLADTEAKSFEELGLSVTELATGLATPWDLVWGPDDFLWVTERRGAVLRIDPADGSSETVASMLVGRKRRERIDGDGVSPRLRTVSLRLPFSFVR